jgi:hypothetical protein
MSSLQTSLPTHTPEGFLPTVAPAAALTALNRKIDSLKTRVAEEFLELAAVLQANSQHAREITSASHRATGAEVGEQSSRSIAVLQNVLTDSASVTEMVATSTQKMSEILAHVTVVDAPLARLAKMSTLLQVVSILCKIEGGKITDVTVDTSGLAQDIDRLAGEVTRHVNEIVDDASALFALLQHGVADLNRFGNKERAESGELIAHTQSLLAPALARAEASQAAARIIDEQYEAFHRATDKIVMSLQSEDLARQRIEHVQEALRLAATRLDAGDSAASCVSVLSLQRAQLVSTRDLLSDSVANIRSGLQSLVPQIQQLLAKTSTLSTQTKEEGESFAELIDDGMKTVANVFRQCSSSAGGVVSIVNQMLPSVKKMSNRASALEAIESSIRMISLNATVKTSLLGAEGAAMGVLASELHRVTTERGSDATLVLTNLRAIHDALDGIGQGKSVAQESFILSSDSATAVSDELAGLSTAVRSASQQAALGLDEVTQLAESLCTELTRGVELAQRAASLRDTFDELLASFNSAFEQLGLSAGSMPINQAGHDQDGHVAQDLSHLYSMHSERVLHRQTFGGDTAAAPLPMPADATTPPGEFGDDIELF